MPDDVVMLWSDDKCVSRRVVYIALVHLPNTALEMCVVTPRSMSARGAVVLVSTITYVGSALIAGNAPEVRLLRRSTTSVFPGHTSGLR